MKNNTYSRLDILGAGPAGLGIGYFAKKNDIPFSIYELSNQIGGNCKTIIRGEFRYDTGAHRLHDKHPNITSEIKILLGDDLKKITIPSKIYHNGSLIDFPLNIISLLKNLKKEELFKIGFENFLNIFNFNGNKTNFKELAYQRYGKTLSDLFLINYTEKLWGNDASELDPRISGNRLKNLNIASIVKQIFVNKFDQSHLDGSFLYPKHGFGQIFEKIYDFIGQENVSLNSKITKLTHDGKKITKIYYKEKKSVKAGMVINTLPINILADVLDPSPPKNIIEILDSIEFRNVRLCILFLNKAKFSDNASIYFPDPSVPFNRIYEPKNRGQQMAPKNKTCIVVESSQTFNESIESDEIFFQKVESSLIKYGLLKKGDVFEHEEGLIPNAYPILKVGTSEKLKTALSYFNSFENHLLHGRNAEFEYIHTHDLLLRSKMIINQIKK